MIKKEERNFLRKRRAKRKKDIIFGKNSRPRLNVFKSLKHIYAQIIDDENAKTIISCSTLNKEIREQTRKITKTESAKLVGKLIAKMAKEKGIERVVFDRGGYLYHGRVKALADEARSSGLKF